MLICLIFISNNMLQAQVHSGHLYPPHNTGSICRGFATARAYGHRVGESGCDPATLNLSAISGTFFYIYAENTVADILSKVKLGDLIMWGPTGDIHVAIVSTIPSGPPYTTLNVKLDQVKQLNASPDYGMTLQAIMDQRISAERNPTHWATRKGNSIKFDNNFDGGLIKVNGNIDDAPTFVTVNPGGAISVEGEMINNQFANNRKYVFVNWSNGSSSSTLTVTPTSDTTITANFEDYPDMVTGFQFVHNVGEPIKFTWDDHPLGNVNYRIYRIIKQVQGETLIATLTHGHTAFTDWNYHETSGYTNYLIDYNVRAYFTNNGNEADANWYTIFGDNPPGGFPKTTAASGTPKEFGVSNYPNPFNPSTTITVELPEASKLTLVIYDLMGREVMSWSREHQKSGYMRIEWDGSDRSGNSVSTGMYLYRLQARSLESEKNFVAVRKMLFMK